MKTLLLCLLLCATPAWADSIHYTAQECPECWGVLVPPGQIIVPNLPPVDLDMLMTVVPVVGSFWDPQFNAFFTGSFLEVIAIAGTLNGQAISGGQDSGLHGPSWISADTYAFGYVSFSAGWIFTEHFKNYSLLSAPGFTPGWSQLPISWTAELVSTPPQASTVPEPSAAVLLVVGLAMGYFRIRKAAAGGVRPRSAR